MLPLLQTGYHLFPENLSFIWSAPVAIAAEWSQLSSPSLWRTIAVLGGGGVRRQEVWEDGTCHPLPSAELVFLPLNRVLSPSLRFLAFLLRCRHSCTETRCICLMGMSQSTNLCIRSDSVIRHLGTNLFVSKAKENLTSFVKSDPSPPKSSS